MDLKISKCDQQMYRSKIIMKHRRWLRGEKKRQGKVIKIITENKQVDLKLITLRNEVNKHVENHQKNENRNSEN